MSRQADVWPRVSGWLEEGERFIGWVSGWKVEGVIVLVSKQASSQARMSKWVVAGR
jgi:hypothetical protein